MPDPRNFEPKGEVQLAPPKDDPITLEQLAAADGNLRFSEVPLSIMVSSLLWDFMRFMQLDIQPSDENHDLANGVEMQDVIPTKST